MAWLLKFILGKVSGPVLIYVVVGLFATNALTGYLLKSAWRKSAIAILECENQALSDANEANVAVVAALELIRKSRDRETQRRLDSTRIAEKEIAAALRAMEVEHDEQIAALEVAINDIDDEDFFCASEPVAFAQLTGMRNAVAAYNQTRNNPSTATDSD